MRLSLTVLFMVMTTSLPAQSVCASFNGGAPLPLAGNFYFVVNAIDNIQAYRFSSPTTLTVAGFQIPTAVTGTCGITGPATIATALYLHDPATGGPQINPVVVSTMSVPQGTPAWCTTTWPCGVTIPANAYFYIGIAHPGVGYCMYLPQSADVLGAQAATAFYRGSMTSSWGPLPYGFTGWKLMWRILCGAACSAPTISAQPNSQPVCAGSSVTLNVVASGASPLTYQWYKAGTAIPGATGSSYTIASVVASSAGNYQVKVTNPYGFVWSAVATVTISTGAPPTILNWGQPPTLTACSGSFLSMTIYALGTQLSYQWFKNGVPLPVGVIPPVLNIDPVTTASAGNYWVVVTSGGTCSITSPTCTLSVTAPPAITVQPLSQSVCLGAPVTFSVTATGTALTYQWQYNSYPIPGANATSLTLNAAQGNYRVVVSNATCSVTSANAVLTVNQPPSITAHPQNVSTCIGQNATFSVAASGSGTLAYQWRRNGSSISGATSATYTVIASSALNGSSYSCVVSSATCGASSNAATLTVAPAFNAIFTATPTFGGTPLLVAFQHVNPANVVTWAWDFQNDGMVDATTQNPVFTYVTAGTYSVRLTVTNNLGCSLTNLVPSFITVIPSTGNTLSPEYLQFQFNEVSGDSVFNSASLVLAPSSGTVLPAGVPWQADPGSGRERFKGLESGAGCLGRSSQGKAVETGWDAAIAGSFTVMWWQRMGAIAPPTQGGSNQFYIFSSDGDFWCFTGGSQGQNRFQLRLDNNGSVGLAANVFNTPNVWRHVALTVDTVAGTARSYVDGVLEGVDSFSPQSGPNQLVTTGSRFTIGGVLSGSSPPSVNGSRSYSLYFDLDDFRVSHGARTGAQIQADMLSEIATGSRFGAGYASAGPVPAIDIASAPAIPNPSFVLQLRNAEPNATCLLALGVHAATFNGAPLPMELLPALPGAFINVAAETLLALATSGSGTFDLPVDLPDSPALRGLHIYAQFAVIGTAFALSEGLDLNLQ